MTDAATAAPEVVDPASVGIDPAAVEALVARAHREVESGLLPSCQLAMARDGRIVLFETIGEAEPGSRYTIFSMTKGVVAGAVWLLVGEGRLGWQDRVSDHIEEFGTNGKDAITVEQVITHTGGFPQAPLPPLEGLTSEGRCARFAKWRTVWEPGTRYEYHPTAAHWVLAELIERTSGTDYRSFIHDCIVAPLGMTTFGLGHDTDAVAPGPVGGNELVSVGEIPTPEELEAAFGVAVDLADFQGEVTTEALLAFNLPEVKAVGVPGGGGICTAADIVTYYQGVLDDRAGIWDPDTLARATVPFVELPDPMLGVPAHRSQGLVVAGEEPGSIMRGYGHGQGPRTFGHAGAGGQLAWADPDSGISFCYLTNGLDEHVIRQARRGVGINTRAAACAPAS